MTDLPSPALNSQTSPEPIAPGAAMGTVSLTVWVRRASWNVMNPRIQRVPTP